MNTLLNSTTGNSTQSDDSYSPSDPTVSFLINFGISAAVFITFLILYDILRYYFPGHCYYRSCATSNPANNNYDGTPLQSPERPRPYPFSWILPTLRYPLDKMIQTHGLDAAMYLRFLQTQVRIFLALTIYSCIVLIPTYATAKPDPDTQPLGLERASLVNVAASSPRLWVTLASEIAILVIVLVFLYRDMVKYTECRIQYRADNTCNPSNFAALVMDIPPQFRDQNYLFHAFNTIFPGQIIAVHPVRDAHHVLNLKTRYISAVNKRQRAQLSSSGTNSPKSSPPEPVISYNHADHLAIGSSGDVEVRRRPSSQTEKGEEARPNTYIVVPEDDRSVPHGRPLDPKHTDLTVGADLEKAVRICPIGGIPPSLVTDAPSVQFAGTPSKTKKAVVVNDEQPEIIVGNALTSDRLSESSLNRSDYSSSSIHLPSSRLRALTRTESDNLAYYNRQVSRARYILKDVEKDIDQYAPLTHAAFIVFRSRVATTCAVTAPIFPSISNCKVLRAPDPRAINWNRFNISRYTTRIREYASFSVLTAMTLVWTVPSSFIQGLGNLSNLGKELDFVKEFVENNRAFARFLEGVLPPLLLFLVLLIVPQVFRFIISFERIPSRVNAENKVRNFLFFFYVMSNFVYQVSLGLFFQELGNILDNPRAILDFLSSSLPSQAIFLMKYVLVNSFLGSVIGILNLGRLLFRPMVISRAKTERDKIFADRLFADYPFAKMYALCMMISLISYVYSTISPIINAVALLYFSLAYLCSKQLLLYSHRPMFEGGGHLFRDGWTGLLIGLYVHQLSMISMFLLKNATIQGILTSVSLGFSVWFTIMCRNRFLSRIEDGSLLKQSPTDEEIGLTDEIPAEFSNMYVHPGLKPVEVLENTAMDPATASLQRRESRRHSYHPPRSMKEQFSIIESLSRD